MKKTLKIMALIMSLVLIVSILAGCGAKTTDNGTQKNEEKALEIERGTWNENVYTNEFAKIKFQLPEGWEASNDEEIAKMMNVGTEMLNSDQQQLSKIAEQTSLYDMVVNDPATGASVMVMFEKPTLKVNMDFYMNQLKTGLEQVDSINYTIGDVTTETVSGQEYTVLTATVPDYSMVQKYYVRQEGNYFIDVLVTYIDGLTELDTILSNFQ